MVQQHKTLKGSSADQNQNALGRSLLKHVLQNMYCEVKVHIATSYYYLELNPFPMIHYEIGLIFKFWCALKSAPPSNTTPAITTDTTSKFFII